MPKHKGHGSKPEWFNEHGDVLTNTLHSVEKAEFIEWYALPRAKREPSTLKAFAVAVGVSEMTVHRWKKDPRVVSAVKGLAQQKVIGSFADIIRSMMEIATDPQHKSAVAAARLLIEMAEKAEKVTDSIPLSDMTNDELKELAAGLYDEFDERGAKSNSA